MNMIKYVKMRLLTAILWSNVAFCTTLSQRGENGMSNNDNDNDNDNDNNDDNERYYNIITKLCS